MFDSQSDVAALVYGPGDEPDRLLQTFAGGLARAGCRAAGLIQLGHRRPWDNGVRLVTLPDGDIMALRHETGTSGALCGPDPGQLSAARRKVGAALACGADLVIINRFGRMEADGRGFAPEICEALAADVPVLITVAQERFMAWTRFSHGMGVKLACARAPLEAWWRGVSGAPPGDAAAAAATFCEVAK